MEKEVQIAVIILAAGLGKRMRSTSPKVLLKAGGETLIERLLTAAVALNPAKLVVVIGHGGEDVQQVVSSSKALHPYDSRNLHFAVQKEQLGTGHATNVALESIPDFTGTIVILPGDAPLLKGGTLQHLLRYHVAAKATVTLVSTKVPDPTGYGRVLRNAGKVTGIVEERDATSSERDIVEINSSIYAVDSAFLRPALKRLDNTNAQKEYYLTDIVRLCAQEGQNLAALLVPGYTELSGVNSRSELTAVNAILNQERLRVLIDSGVEIPLPTTVWIDPGCSIEAPGFIGPNTQILGDTKVAAGVTIEGTAFIKDSVIGKDAMFKLGVRVEKSTLGDRVVIGPFANIRPESVLLEEVHIGNFVEVKKSTLEKGVKANHLTYLGDAHVGARSNIGAGTITCNYDGKTKSKTEIGTDAFIGSNSVLIAPLRIGDGAYIGAGSAISKDIEADALAFSRPPLVKKAGWAKQRRKQ
jgi:bifunctional UDP-N-acetylglucosamine pyrophosphorylase/glucosamine-1-phosphate N-acetyltransferase